MESTLCNSVCTLFLQPIFIPGHSSGVAWEYECLANSHVQDMHHKLPNAHKACCFTSSRPGCYCSHGLMLARSPLSTHTHRKLSKLESHTSQFSNPSILKASQMLNKHQTVTLCGLVIPCSSMDWLWGNSKCFQHLWVYAVHISNYSGKFVWIRKQNIKEKNNSGEPFSRLSKCIKRL